jgi:hypothetical protein
MRGARGQEVSDEILSDGDAGLAHGGRQSRKTQEFFAGIHPMPPPDCSGGSLV